MTNEQVEEIKKATLVQKVILATILIAVTIILLFIWVQAFREVEKRQMTEISVVWQQSVGLSLKPGPSTFWHDQDANKLKYRGFITNKIKEDLIALIPDNMPNAEEFSDAILDYKAAISKLAFQSNKSADIFFLYLFLLGGISGMLGIQVRSMVNFIGNACIKDKLDISRWWPWYALRPMIGFLVGFVAVLIIKAGLLNTGMDPTGTVWWLGIALLAGFGATDFTERLRLLSQTIFGQRSKA